MLSLQGTDMAGPCAPLWARAGGNETLQCVVSAVSHQVANSSHHEATWHPVTVASLTAFPACFLLHPLSFSTHTFICNVFSVSIIYKTCKKSMRKDLKKILFERRDQINISSLRSVSKRTSSSVYGEGAKMIATGCIWSRWLQQSSADSWEGFALLGFTATWESSCFAKSHFMALWASRSGARNGLRQGTGKQVAMALGFMVKRGHSSSHSFFYFR